jgi:glycosyltransferase involved in cell wall biosynthesis
MVSEHASPLAVLGGVDAGGQNVHVAELARSMARLGAQVVVHTRRDDPSVARRVEFGSGVTVDHVSAGPPVPLPKDELLPHMGAFARDLCRSWDQQRPDVALSHFWMSGLASVEAGRIVDLPVVHTYHALGVVKRRHQGSADTSPPERVAIERRLAMLVDRVVATTEDERRELVAMGASPSRVDVVPCGVDLDRFSPFGTTVPRPSKRQRVVVVSRLVERKGIGNVIAAIAALPDVELLIAGGPPAGFVDDDLEARRFLELADRLGVADRTVLLGAVPRYEIPALLRSADVVACCPWYEPFGMVALEAMACGVPVVASAVGGLAETVADGSTGLLVQPRSPEAIAAALGVLLNDHGRRAAMGRAGRARAQRYGWERIAEETLAICGQVVAARRSAVPGWAR